MRLPSGSKQPLWHCLYQWESPDPLHPSSPVPLPDVIHALLPSSSRVVTTWHRLLLAWMRCSGWSQVHDTGTWSSQLVAAKQDRGGPVSPGGSSIRLMFPLWGACPEASHQLQRFGSPGGNTVPCPCHKLGNNGPLSSWGSVVPPLGMVDKEAYGGVFAPGEA